MFHRVAVVAVMAVASMLAMAGMLSIGRRFVATARVLVALPVGSRMAAMSAVLAVLVMRMRSSRFGRVAQAGPAARTLARQWRLAAQGAGHVRLRRGGRARGARRAFGVRFGGRTARTCAQREREETSEVR